MWLRFLGVWCMNRIQKLIEATLLCLRISKALVFTNVRSSRSRGGGVPSPWNDLTVKGITANNANKMLLNYLNIVMLCYVMFYVICYDTKDHDNDGNDHIIALTNIAKIETSVLVLHLLLYYLIFDPPLLCTCSWRFEICLPPIYILIAFSPSDQIEPKLFLINSTNIHISSIKFVLNWAILMEFRSHSPLFCWWK